MKNNKSISTTTLFSSVELFLYSLTINYINYSSVRISLKVELKTIAKNQNFIFYSINIDLTCYARDNDSIFKIYIYLILIIKQ